MQKKPLKPHEEEIRVRDVEFVRELENKHLTNDSPCHKENFEGARAWYEKKWHEAYQKPDQQERCR